MQQLNIKLEDWQQAALRELATARGVDESEMAQSILSERLIERAHCSFDDMLEGDALLVGGGPTADTIEQRLRRLFDA
jgi:hypothetical protein